MTTILEEATDIIYGDREKTYGHPGINLERTASLWSVLLETPITSEQVALCMVALKLARHVHAPKRDNLVDAVGYLALIERLNELEDASDATVAFPRKTDCSLCDRLMGETMCDTCNQVAVAYPLSYELIT